MSDDSAIKADDSMHSYTELPLHPGHAPRWLFGRMVKLGGAICEVIMDEFGADELARRLSDTDWFQALSCAIGYDWHSSGTTTVTMGALKLALNESGEIFIAGGKGKAGNRTPQDIEKGVDMLSVPNCMDPFVEQSRLSAKIDSALVYDNIGIYQHCFLFTKNKKWTVVQQAIDGERNKAIRFQWFSDGVDERDISNEPHSGMSTELRVNSLDLTNQQNKWARDGSIEALSEYQRMQGRIYPSRHEIIPQIDISRRGIEAIRKASEVDPQSYKELLLVKGVGRATLRSLAFVSSLIYDRELVHRDPVAFAYNLGGKDKIPFEINRKTYDSVIDGMSHIIDQARIEPGEKYKVLKRLSAQMAVG